MNSAFPVTHSILSIAALLAKIAAEYPLDRPINGHFLHLGLNDTFLLKTSQTSYILRAYRHRWRTREQILYELEALQHLEAQGAKVSVPILRRDGELISQVNAPEGLHYLVLFSYVEGHEPRYDLKSSTIEDFVPPQNHHSDAYLYGRSVAQIHTASDRFTGHRARFSLDFDHLLVRPLRYIFPLLSHRLKDWHYLCNLAHRVQQILENLPIEQLETGFCHGDFHGGNAHIKQNSYVESKPIKTTDRSLTFFDFDCCGQGWRAYDLAVFRWSVSVNGYQRSLWDDFLSGYREERTIADVDLAAIPYFIVVRQVWMLGLHCGNGGDWGFGWLNDRYFDRALTFLHDWEADQK